MTISYPSRFVVSSGPMSQYTSESGLRVATDVLKALGGGNPVHSDDNVALCERERSRIEAACRNAFAEGPSPRILVDVRHLLPGRQN